MEKTDPVRKVISAIQHYCTIHVATCQFIVLNLFFQIPYESYILENSLELVQYM